MPRKYVPKTKKYRKRPRYARRQKRSLLSFSKAPMPNKHAAKLRYVSDASINIGLAGVAGVQVVRANGAFDPDQTGVGHQPRGFDQLMTMYDHYTVIGAKVTACFMHVTGSAYNNIQVGIALKDRAATYADVNDYLEGRNVVSTLLPGNNIGDANQCRTLSKTFSCRKFFGISHPMSNPNVRGSVASNPGEEAYFHLFAGPLNSVGTDEPVMKVQFRIDYLIIFTEPVQPNQS